MNEQIKELEKQRAALEAKIAATIKEEHEKKLAEEALAEKLRSEEIEQVKLKINDIMKKYNLTEEDVFPPEVKTPVKPVKAGLLSEIRAWASKS